MKKNPDSICAFFILELDNFKLANDSLGHSMGDIAIKDTAQKLTLVFSIKDIIARMEGNEFCVFTCFPDTFSNERALSIIKDKAEQLCSVIYEMYFNDDSSVSIEVSCSIGIVILPEHGTSFEQLFENADSALYNVKHNEKNNYKIYSSETENGSECVCKNINDDSITVE